LPDIFGVQKGSTFEHGLIDSNSEASFDTALEHLNHRWNNLERSCISSTANQRFYFWFLKYKAADIKACVLPSVRVKAGFDSTCKFTTNMSESINHVIKQEVDWKESKLPVLIDHLKTVVHKHVNEFQRAVIARGEWKFISPYKHLQIPQAIWFLKNSEFKEKHMKKVQGSEVKSAAPLKDGNSTLSVPFQSCGLANIAGSTLSNIWSKATMLVKSKDVLNAPWLCDEKARLVNSNSSLHPHIVTMHKTNKRLYCCDDKCPMIAGFSICSHVVAVTECNGDLKSFLDAASATCAPNLSAIANQGLPRGAGRKGGIPKCKRKTAVPIQSRSVHPCLVGTAGTSSMSKWLRAVTWNHHNHPTSLLLWMPRILSPSCTQGTNDFDLLESLTCSAVQKSSALPVQSPTAHLPSSSSTLTLQSLQQPCISPPSVSFPPTTVSLPASTVSQATSPGQLVLGTGVNFNIRPPSILQSLPVVSNTGNPTPGCTANRNSKPFTIKLRTKQIKICQSCCKDYEVENDTLGLVVANPERKWISSPVTGAQFWGKESSSHYHANMMCLKKAEVHLRLKYLRN